MADQLEFRIHGMDCADEVAILRRELEPLVRTPDRLAFDILRGKMIVRPGAPPVGASAVIGAVARTGMWAEPWQDVQPGTAEADFWQRRGRTILTTLSGIFLVAAFSVHALQAGIMAALGEGVPPAAMALYAAGVVTGAWFIVPRAWKAARRLRPDMHLLMTIAVMGAIGIGEWFEGAVVTFLFALSLALESWSVNRARRAVEALLAIAPPTARRMGADGQLEEVAAADVLVGDQILVKPGDRIPLDGSVRAGTSHVN